MPLHYEVIFGYFMYFGYLVILVIFGYFWLKNMKNDS